MQLARYLDKLFQKDGFLLIDANSNKYIIGTPKNNSPITVKILDKKLHYKLFLRPDLYFGEAYSNGDIKIDNGSLSDFLDIALMNIGRGELNLFSMLINKFYGSYRYLTNFNFIKKFSDWPTIPQVYIKGEFVGGCDIVKEMYENGELKKVLEDKGINFKK